MLLKNSQFIVDFITSLQAYLNKLHFYTLLKLFNQVLAKHHSETQKECLVRHNRSGTGTSRIT